MGKSCTRLGQQAEVQREPGPRLQARGDRHFHLSKCVGEHAGCGATDDRGYYRSDSRGGGGGWGNGYAAACDGGSGAVAAS